MKARTYVFLFVLLALIDALTTWFGVRLGFEEANEVIAERLSDPALFFGSYALFTALGAGVIVISIRMEKLSPTFKLIALGMVLLKAIPVANNIIILVRPDAQGLVPTTVFPLIRFLIYHHP